MILITTAIKEEARPLIDAFGLKAIKDKAFRIYTSDDVILIISGIGRELASSAVSYAMGRFDGIKGAVNFGFAGSLDKKIKPGDVVVANAFYSDTSDKVIIPDIFFFHGFKETAVRTFDRIVTSSPEEENTVVDEEAYGFATAARCFLDCDKVSAIKLVSDDATDCLPLEADRILPLLDKASETVTDFIKRFFEHCKKEAYDFPSEIDDICLEIKDTYHLTVAETEILKNAVRNTYVTYGTLPDINKLPPAEGRSKKKNMPLLIKLVNDITANINCTACYDFFKKPALQRSFFKHTYVERSVISDKNVSCILSSLNNTKVVPIPHYKNVFNRPKQNTFIQRANKNLILAKATGKLLYEGSDYCSSFGFDKFYYCSTVMGCIYDCEYCYLQGMYPTANITAFINTEDFFEAINKVDDGSPMLVCVSYDSDIAALDDILGTVSKWLDFARKKPNITFEIRTKSVSLLPFEKGVPDNVIIAYTLSPDKAAKDFEHFTPPVFARLNAAEELSSRGVRVRLCIEPCLCPIVKKEDYSELADEIIMSALTHRYEDIVVGGFRMNKPYFTNIRAKRKDSKLFYTPFAETCDNTVTYTDVDRVVIELGEKLENETDVKIVTFI